MPNKLTYAEVKKALEVCIDGYCRGCCYGDTDQRHCRDDLMQEALDLINRQEGVNEKNENIIRVADKTIATLNAENESLKAEVERLKTERDKEHDYCNHYMIQCVKAKTKAYKECVEVVKKLWGNYSGYEFEKKINNLLNELVGDGDA